MALYLEILDGEQKGLQFAVAGGTTIGRRPSNITLRDSKVSGNHARVEERPGGQLVLIDLGSANGIRQQEERLTELELVPGAEFIIGRTPFRVMQTADDAPLSFAGPGEIVVVPEAVAPKKTWRDHLAALALRAMEDAQAPAANVVALNPPLIFTFVRGVQNETEWTIGYAPRIVGSASIDLVLEEVGIPATCFWLLANEKGVWVQPEPSAQLKINGRLAETHFLNEGDVLEIKNTMITVAFRQSVLDEPPIMEDGI